MKFIKKHLYISFLFLVAACSSQLPTSFYLLETIEAKNLPENGYRESSTTLLINPIKFPEYLDRPQMVIRENLYKLQLTEKHRWAEPLKNEFTRVFIENLNNRILPGHALVYSELNGAQPDIKISIEVLQFDVSTKNQAVLSVKWSYWKDTTDIKRLSKKFIVPVKDKSYESRVEAQSQAIASLSDYIVKIIKSHS